MRWSSWRTWRRYDRLSPARRALAGTASWWLTWPGADLAATSWEMPTGRSHGALAVSASRARATLAGGSHWLGGATTTDRARLGASAARAGKVGLRADGERGAFL